MGKWFESIQVGDELLELNEFEQEEKIFLKDLPASRSVLDVLRKLSEYGESFREKMIAILLKKCLEIDIPSYVQECFEDEASYSDEVKSIGHFLRQEMNSCIPYSETEKMTSEYLPEIKKCKNKKIPLDWLLSRMQEERARFSAVSLLVVRQRALSQNLSHRLFFESLRKNLKQLILPRFIALLAQRINSNPEINRREMYEHLDYFCQAIADYHVESLSGERILTLSQEIPKIFTSDGKPDVKMELAEYLSRWAFDALDYLLEPQLPR